MINLVSSCCHVWPDSIKYRKRIAI